MSWQGDRSQLKTSGYQLRSTPVSSASSVAVLGPLARWSAIVECASTPSTCAFTTLSHRFVMVFHITLWSAMLSCVSTHSACGAS